jgi:hypothetical protein
MPPMQKNALVDCPIIVFVYSKLGTSNSPQRMAKQHATTLRFEKKLMGKLANVPLDYT